MGRRRTGAWRPAGPEWAVVALLSVPVLAGTLLPHPSVPGSIWAAALLLPFLGWRRWPDAVMVVLVLLGAAQLSLTDSPTIANVTMMAGLFAVARRGPRVRSGSWLAVMIVGAAVAAFDWTRDEVGQVTAGVLWWDRAVLAGVQIGLALLAVLAGDLLRLTTTLRIERSAATRAEHEHQVRMAVLAERSQIGREVHDIVGHALALIAVQAEAGHYVATAPSGEIHVTAAERLDQAGSALASIKAQASGALDETRALVRRIGDEPATRAPIHHLGDVTDLVAELRRTGIDTDLTVSGDPKYVDAPIQASLYRIVQEALTNAVKHSDRGQITVDVVISSETITATITSTNPRPSTTGEGRGLAGMTARAHAHAGLLTAQLVDSDRYEVRVVLPVHSEEQR